MAVRYPKVGEIVLYTMDEGNHVGEERPAIIVQVWSENVVNLVVFVDGDNDLQYPQLSTIDTTKSPPTFGKSNRPVLTIWRTSRHRQTESSVGGWRYSDG